MKMTRFFLTAVLIGSLLTSCTNESDTRTFDEFLEVFADAVQQAGYEGDNDEPPAYKMIGAKDGIMVHLNGKVFKIYHYENEKAYKQALKDFPIVKSMTRNGLFVAESNSEELLEIFKSIPKKLKNEQNEQYEEAKNDDLTVPDNKNKWEYSEETKIDPMDNTSIKMILASLKSDNSIAFGELYGSSNFTLSIRNLEGSTDVLLYGNNSGCPIFDAGFDGEKTYRVKFDDEAPVNIAVAPSKNSRIVFFGNAEKLISKLETTDKLTIEAEFYGSSSKQIITFSTKGLKWENSKSESKEQSNPLLLQYNLKWGASIQTVQNAFAKVWGSGNSLWEPTKDRREDWEQFASVGVRVFCTAGAGDDCFYFYQGKLYRIHTYDYNKDEEVVYFDENIDKQVRDLID